MRVLISGATGLIGSALGQLLLKNGDEVTCLARKDSIPKIDWPKIIWDAKAEEIDLNALENFDAVVHLAGENVGKKHWSPEIKKRIMDSRVVATKFLSESLAKLNSPPSVFICASALGYYGETGDQPVTETSPPGKDFLSNVCANWEAACQPARDANIRTVNARIGVVLSTEGGALKKMLTPFRMGLGGVVGSGQQYWSWVSHVDVINALKTIMEDESFSGPVNLVSPNSVTNRVFTKTLGKVLSRPTLLPLPTIAVRMMMGEMGETLLLTSTRVVPEVLLNSKFEFQHPELEIALKAILKS